tara:strand:- start:194 stop:394 length:201 start_codon:yes stop_codon:yes gene_type:complete
MSQPWEKERTTQRIKNKKERKSIREKIGLVTNAIALSGVACTFIYASVVYECFKEIAYKIDPKLKT